MEAVVALSLPRRNGFCDLRLPSHSLLSLLQKRPPLSALRMSLDAATLVALAAALAGVLAYVAFGRGMAGKRAGAMTVSVFSLSLCFRSLWLRFGATTKKVCFLFSRLLSPPFSPPWLSVFPLSRHAGDSRPKVALGL